MRCIEAAMQDLEIFAADVTWRDVTDVLHTWSASKVSFKACSDCICIVYSAQCQKSCPLLAYVAALQFDNTLHSIVHTIK